MKTTLTIVAVVAAALTATSATSAAYAACPAGQISAARASGGMACVVPAKNFDGCIRNSLRNGWPNNDQTAGYCRNTFPNR